MFPTFISILDIQSWWEVPSIAHFCSLFRTAFNLLDFDIEDLEEALLTDGTEETSWLQEIIVRLLSGCLPNNEISTFNYQMFLRRLFRQKCQEHDTYNPFNTDIDFQLLPLRTKVDILQALCDFRLDAEDVLDQLKNLEADSLRVEPLGYDSNDSAYWYFYGTRLYREDFHTKGNKKKSVWQVICFTEDDWFQLTKKFKKSSSKAERQLYQTLSENFLPELPRLFREKENLARKRLLENLPRRTSTRLKKPEPEATTEKPKKSSEEKRDEEEKTKNKKLASKRQEAYERRLKLKEQSEEESQSESSVDRNEMVRTKSQKSKKTSNADIKGNTAKSSKRQKKSDNLTDNLVSTPSKPTTVGRQTNNSLSAATGQILIQPLTNPAKKVKTSQIFRQTDEDLQTGMHKILDFVKNHEDAWPFTDPVEEEYAPNYYSIIRKPMDLQRMEDRLDGGYYKTFAKFRADFQLIVDNCRLYNGAENEYTIMVDNLLKVFERATEKYLDQITSSDDEIAIDFSNVEIERGSTTKSEESTRKRKPMLAAQTDKKRDRSSSRDSLARSKTGSVESLDNISVKSKKSEKASKKQKNKNNKTKKNKVSPKKESKKEKYEIKEKEKKAKHESKKEKEKQKEGKKSKGRKSKSNKSNKEKKKEVAHKSPSRCRSSSQSPTRSNVSSPPASWPPSSPESRFDFTPHRTSKKRHSQEMSDTEESPPKEKLKKSGGHKHVTDSSEVLTSPNRKQKGDNDLLLTPRSLSPKPKDKHNKLRETIEKLKAKSEMKLKDEFNFELDLPKENKDKPKKVEKEEKNKQKKKDKSLKPKKDEEVDLETNSTLDSVLSEGKKSKKNSGVSAVPSAGGGVQKIAAPVAPVPLNKSLPNLDALSMATEQTLKDINKWLDDTPKFSEFNSASNSPSYTGLDDFETLIGAKVETSQTKKVEKPPTGAPTVKKEGTKDNKKRSFRDPSKLFKRREVQRTIDRLQPGKSKGNLISNVQSTNKTDEMFSLGPLSKIKDTKNSLIVKTDSNAPKLSLGSVLDSFGKHKFVDDQKKEDADQERPTTPKSDPTSEVKISDPEVNEKQQTESVVIEATEAKSEPNEKEPQVVKDSSPIGGATPNLSAWFRAFGAPKMAAPIKKTDLKPDGKENEKCEDISTKSMEGRKVTLPLASPNTDMPLHGQPVPRQRKISTGSSMSERSSFSQDMDSPRVGMDERGAYPAPYPSPLHRSPSGASPIMASPRPDISPKAYPTINGQIRVGFYQDTVSNKSSPDKSCSPRETPQSPYGHYSEHVYTPNTTGSSHYSHPNSPHYSQAPVYSNTNPTPPYNLESYYDTSKSLADQYQSKSHNYSANSPASSHSSPASHPHQSQHSPTVGCSPLVVASSPATPATPATPAPHSPRPSPTAYQQTPNSPLVVPQDSPAVHSQGPSPEVHSPASVQPASLITQPQQSPSVHSQHSADSQDLDAYPQQHQDIRAKSPPMQIQQVNQTPMFPVKKRMYSDNEMPGHQYDTQQQTNQSKSQVETKDYTQPTHEPQSQPAQMEHLSKTSYAQSQILHQEVIGTKSPYPQGLTTNVPVTSQYATPFSGDSGYPLNIPSTRNIASQQTKIDLSKYTNMGYTGPDINYTRSLQQLAQQTQTTINSMISQKPASVASTTISQASNVARYGNPLQQMTSQRAHSNFGANLDRLAQVQDVPSGYKPDAVAKSSYGGNTAGMTMEQQLALGASRELAHIVDRLSGEDRLMAGLQTSSSFYTDKGLGTTGSHMFNKPISTSASALPIFSQSGGIVAGMQSYGQAGQSTATTMYNRQMAELMQQQQQQQQQQNEQQKVVQEKKSKRKKSNKSATSATSTNQQQQLSTSAQQQAQQQGFQSYAGLKGHPAASAEAIALKTSSVVPGSAFNFGPTTAGLAGLYAAAEKDAYPNFLDEFRAAAPNYYMAAAQAARHRSTPDKVPTDKQQQSRTAVAAHQSSTGQPSASAAASYPSFLGATPAHHQPTRPAYPPTIGSPFISNAQAAQLMDTSSPLYQQYIQAGLLNQGLLGPPGAYPPGYHPALSLRQPYDSMTRPSWL